MDAFEAVLAVAGARKSPCDPGMTLAEVAGNDSLSQLEFGWDLEREMGRDRRVGNAVSSLPSDTPLWEVAVAVAKAIDQGGHCL